MGTPIKVDYFKFAGFLVPYAGPFAYLLLGIFRRGDLGQSF
jgi:hypothetical protein